MTALMKRAIRRLVRPRTFAAAALSAVACVVLVACGTSAGGKKSMVIASSNPMTGDSGYYGQDKVRAMRLAISQVNAKGGIRGEKVRLIVNDDAGDPGQGASLAARECGNQDIIAVLGHWNSSVSLAAAPIYKRCKLPNVNDVTTPKMSGISPYSYRIFATALEEGKVLAQYARAKGYKSAGVLNDTNDYGISLADSFRSNFTRLGGKVVASDSYVEGDKNFVPKASKFKSANPDAVFIAGYYVETALAAKAFRQVGMKQPLIGGDGIDAPQLVEIGKGAVEGIVFADDYSSELKSKRNQDFVQLWRSRFKSDPDTFAALAYDATKLVLAGMRSGATSRDSLQNYLQKVKNFPGVTGNISFDDKNDAARAVYMLVVRDGKIRLNQEQVTNGKLVNGQR